MPYVTSIDRLARKEGYEEGLLEAIALVLKRNFGEDGLKLLPHLRKDDRAVDLQALLSAILEATSLDEVRELLREP